jgi:hypothetical protein
VSCPAAHPPTSPGTIYLAFDGVTLDSVADGLDDATTTKTSLVDRRTRFSAFLDGDPTRADVIAGLVSNTREILAPFAVEITTTRPAGDHLMVVLAAGTGTLYGLVRHDCDNAVRNDVVILFDPAADPSRGPYALANEVVFLIARSIGLEKTTGPGQPCSCDPSGTCDNEALCQMTTDAEVGSAFAGCPGRADVQDDRLAFANAFGCR